MSILNKHIAIPKNVETKDDLDFHFLRTKGIEYIESLGGSLWTDLNAHDPGVTILDVLCYAITDLGMRIDMPIEHLLSSDGDNEAIMKQFYKASEVFPGKALTALDYRKLFIDINGVKNCWLRAYEKTVYVNCKENKLSYNNEDFNTIDEGFQNQFNLKGLYTLLVEFEPLDNDLTFVEKQSVIATVKQAIKTTYHENRNLCEDLIEIEAVETQGISICTSIEVNIEANEEEVHANVLHQINNYLSPSLSFYSIKEMLGKGYTTDQIFDGPLLNNGFIDTEELKNTALRREVRLSDIMKIIMNVEGVKLIKDLTIGHCDRNKPLENDWVICVDYNKKPELCKQSTFSYHKDVLPLNINTEEVKRFTKALDADQLERITLAKADKDLTFPTGIYLDSSQYNTIQNDFPDTYGIGQEGLNARATTERKAQAKQLKSYLLFFDKTLASYFQHLGKVKDLLSVSGAETKTYFTQALKDIKDFDSLVKEYPKANNTALTTLLFDKFDTNITRRNEILDHLLARFAERFGDYTFLMKTLYGTAANEITLANKEAFLKDYVTISSERGTAFNYYKQAESALWNTNNISGFQKRVSRLVGIKDYSRRHLTTSFIGIYDMEVNGEKVYLWDIKNTEGTVILSSVKTYSSSAKASEDLYVSVLQIIQTTIEAIESQFENEIDSNTVIDYIKIEKGNASEYGFQILYEAEVIAEQNNVYNSLDTLRKGIINTLLFFKQQFTEEGFFLIEHVLLRPDVTTSLSENDTFLPICADACDACNIDPYSYQVSIILPGYTYRFSNPDFRRYMETIIKEELPAHILPRICWVGYRKEVVADTNNDLLGLEAAYKAYLLEKTDLEQEQPIDQEDNKHKKLIQAMSKLNTIYPVGRLLDCANENDELEGRIILGQTNLGTLKTNSDED